jgi:hypothetical protein
MQNNLHKTIYKEFVYCHPDDHLLKPNNKLTRPNCNSKILNAIHSNIQPFMANPQNVITIQSDITGHYNNIYANNITPEIDLKQRYSEEPKENQHKIKQVKRNSLRTEEEPQPTVIFDEDTFNQIELRGFITKELLKQSLEKGSNLFHIAQEVFDKLCNRYNQFKEILHTLNTEFDTTIECIIETGKELTKKIAHIIYELYLAVMNRHLD